MFLFGVGNDRSSSILKSYRKYFSLGFRGWSSLNNFGRSGTFPRTYPLDWREVAKLGYCGNIIVIVMMLWFYFCFFLILLADCMKYISVTSDSKLYFYCLLDFVCFKH